MVSWKFPEEVLVKTLGFGARLTVFTVKTGCAVSCVPSASDPTFPLCPLGVAISPTTGMSGYSNQMVLGILNFLCHGPL